jgi:hypothetical protein
MALAKQTLGPQILSVGQLKYPATEAPVISFHEVLAAAQTDAAAAGKQFAVPKGIDDLASYLAGRFPENKLLPLSASSILDKTLARAYQYVDDASRWLLPLAGFAALAGVAYLGTKMTDKMIYFVPIVAGSGLAMYALYAPAGNAKPVVGAQLEAIGKRLDDPSWYKKLLSTFTQQNGVQVGYYILQGRTPPLYAVDGSSVPTIRTRAPNGRFVLAPNLPLVSINAVLAMARQAPVPKLAIFVYNAYTHNTALLMVSAEDFVSDVLRAFPDAKGYVPTVPVLVEERRSVSETAKTVGFFFVIGTAVLVAAPTLLMIAAASFVVDRTKNAVQEEQVNPPVLTPLEQLDTWKSLLDDGDRLPTPPDQPVPIPPPIDPAQADSTLLVICLEMHMMSLQ